MISYETLDAIADSYIPILLVLYIAGLLSKLYKHWPQYQRVVIHFGFLTGLLVIAYSLMFFDNAVHLWPRMGLDYSTHTSVALALIIALSMLFPARWKWFVTSMVAYYGLMFYQKYHSLLDIISTGVVIGLLSFILFKIIFKNQKK